MTEQSNAELIAETREGFRIAVVNGWARVDDGPLAMRLAAALEAADQRAAELATVVEKVREVLRPDQARLGRTLGSVLQEVRSALDTAPADFLREQADRESCKVCGRADGAHKMSCRPQNRADADREPSDAEVKAAKAAYEAEYEFASTQGMCAALLAAQEVRGVS